MILFRVDGNMYIGIGHIMRCLSIADEVRNVKEECIFVTASNHMSEIIKKRGYINNVLNTDFNQMELENIYDIIDKYKPRAIVVDSYYVTKEYLENIKEFAENNNCKLVYIDDVYSFPYSCHKLINYNVYANKSIYEKMYNTKDMPKLLLGSKYAPLRKEFKDIDIIDNKNYVKNVFVSTGGADTDHLAVEIVKFAKGCDLNFHFIIGAMNQDKQILKDIADANKNIVLHENVVTMSKIMRECDVAISAAGATLYELCAIRIPTITYVLADNQIPGAKAFCEKGCMIYGGDIRGLGAKKLAEELVKNVKCLSCDYEKRQLLSRKMGDVVDGKGAERIANEILN